MCKQFLHLPGLHRFSEKQDKKSQLNSVVGSGQDFRKKAKIPVVTYHNTILPSLLNWKTFTIRKSQQVF